MLDRMQKKGNLYTVPKNIATEENSMLASQKTKTRFIIRSSHLSYESTVYRNYISIAMEYHPSMHIPDLGST